MKKSTKRIVSMMLAASMMFTTVAANPTFAFAAAEDVAAYAAFTGTATVDFAEVHAAHPDWGDQAINGDDLGNGLSVVTAGSGFDFKGAWNATAGTPGVFSDGTECKEKFQIGKGNKAIAETVAVGDSIGGAPEKGLKLEAGAAGTATIYADAGSSSLETPYYLLLVDETFTVVDKVEKTKGTLEPSVLTVPAAGTYYIVCPGNTTSVNVGMIKLALEGGPVDTTESTTEATTEAPTEATTEAPTEATTEAPTEATTEAPTEATTEAPTEAPTYKEDTILVQAVAPVAVAQDGHNVVDQATNKTFNVNIDLSQVENFAATNDGNGINNFTFFVSYNPEVVKMTGVAKISKEDIDKYVNYEVEDAFGEVTKNLIYDPVAIANNIALVPGSDDPDYTDVTTSGAANTLTCAELGKVKFANTINAQNADKTLKTANNSGTLVTLTFEVLNAGDTALKVDIASNRVDGFKSNPTSAKKPAAAELAANIWVGDVKEETSTETTTESTTVTTTETSTVAPTTEATTVAPTTEASSETTTATETTTKRRSSGGGGGGGSSSHKASSENKDNAASTSGTKEPGKTPSTKPSVTGPSFTITNNSGKVVTIAPPMNDSKNVSFADISSRPWATDAITKLAKLGIINGVSENSFAPDAYSKRADFVIMITNTLGLAGTATSNFTDVYAGKYYYNAVGLGYEAGIVEGYGDGTFGPEKYCTREEMMVLVAQTFKFLGEDITASESVLDKYADNASISWWAKPYVAYLTEEGVATGTGANLEPSVYITRAQMAVMIEKVYNKVVDMAEEAMAAAEAEAAAAAAEAEESTEETTEASEDESSEETTAEDTTAEETTETTTEAE